MVEVDEKTLRQIQMVQLEMLEEVDRICKKCNIHYNIIAGTLLGAIRHGGYIPWDDDADVAMMRTEYEKFRKACRTELDKSRFYFQDHRNTKGYRWGYGKLRRKDTLFLREFQEHMPYRQGICIDVFPLDAVPNNYFLRSLKNFECFCVRKILWSKVGKIADKNFLKRQWFKILDKIPEKQIFKYYHGMIRRAGRKKTRMVRILTFPTPNDEWGYYRSWYENSTDIVFEGITFRGIKDYDSYLSFKFGEYMTLPPMEKRKVHPVSKLIIGNEVWE
ncbi:MAG: LicD family protein [Lachnospiraceae bacterium]|nr:LicD family protein [Lachnospiraceae bacterium]